MNYHSLTHSLTIKEGNHTNGIKGGFELKEGCTERMSEEGKEDEAGINNKGPQSKLRYILSINILSIRRIPPTHAIFLTSNSNSILNTLEYPTSNSISCNTLLITFTPYHSPTFHYPCTFIHQQHAEEEADKIAIFRWRWWQQFSCECLIPIHTSSE